MIVLIYAKEKFYRVQYFSWFKKINISLTNVNAKVKVVINSSEAIIMNWYFYGTI